MGQIILQIQSHLIFKMTPQTNEKRSSAWPDRCSSSENTSLSSLILLTSWGKAPPRRSWRKVMLSLAWNFCSIRTRSEDRRPWSRAQGLSHPTIGRCPSLRAMGFHHEASSKCMSYTRLKTNELC